MAESAPGGLMIRGLSLDRSRIGPESYLRRVPAIWGLKTLSFTKPVTFFAGENGSGKSTLLSAVAAACGFGPEGGTRNYRFSTYDAPSELAGAIRLVRGARSPRFGYYLRAESFFNVATKEEEYSRGPGGVPQHYHERSHGESFLALAGNVLRPSGLYLFDEPEAGLSPERQLALLAEMARCAREGAQFLVVTHSPFLLALPGAEILCFDGGSIHPCAYEETESYRLTALFIENRERVLHRLMGEEEDTAEEDA